MKMKNSYKQLIVKNKNHNENSFIFFIFLAAKSLDAFNTSNKLNKNENNLQRSLIIQSSALFNNDENDMASMDWLKIYGVKAQKLDFFSALQSAALQHCNEVGNLQKSLDDINGKNDKSSVVSECLYLTNCH